VALELRGRATDNTELTGFQSTPYYQGAGAKRKRPDNAKISAQFKGARFFASQKT